MTRQLLKQAVSSPHTSPLSVSILFLPLSETLSSCRKDPELSGSLSEVTGELTVTHVGREGLCGGWQGAGWAFPAKGCALKGLPGAKMQVPLARGPLTPGAALAAGWDCREEETFEALEVPSVGVSSPAARESEGSNYQRG